MISSKAWIQGKLEVGIKTGNLHKMFVSRDRVTGCCHTW